MNEAIITLIEHENGIAYTKVYRVEYEGRAHMILDEGMSYESERPPKWVSINVVAIVAMEQLKAT